MQNKLGFHWPFLSLPNWCQYNVVICIVLWAIQWSSVLVDAICDYQLPIHVVNCLVFWIYTQCTVFYTMGAREQQLVPMSGMETVLEAKQIKLSFDRTKQSEKGPELQGVVFLLKSGRVFFTEANTVPTVSWCKWVPCISLGAQKNCHMH